ncbi:helix-turn-helix domain-containing protein [Klebsiella aerogenes]
MFDNFYAYIECAKETTIYDSNISLAKYLDVPPNRISQWRINRAYVSPTDCILLAKLLGISVEEIAFVSRAQEAKIPDEKKKWLSLAAEYARPVNPPDKYKKHK